MNLIQESRGVNYKISLLKQKENQFPIIFYTLF